MTTTYSIRSSNGNHRNDQFCELVEDIEHIIDGFEMVIVRLISDNQWWIVPNSSLHDDVTVDFGPYETVDLAIIHLKLLAD